MTFNVTLRVPVVVGLRVTLIVQLALAPRELPQPLVCAKSPGSIPASVMLVIVIAIISALLTIRDSGRAEVRQSYGLYASVVDCSPFWMN